MCWPSFRDETERFGAYVNRGGLRLSFRFIVGTIVVKEGARSTGTVNSFIEPRQVDDSLNVFVVVVCASGGIVISALVAGAADVDA